MFDHELYLSYAILRRDYLEVEFVKFVILKNAILIQVMQLLDAQCQAIPCKNDEPMLRRHTASLIRYDLAR